MKNFTLITLLLLFALPSFGQLKVDGLFRTRMAMQHGYRNPIAKDIDPLFAADQRSRIILNYKKEKYEVRFTLQDARVWGAEDMYNATGLQRSSYALGVYEAWVELKLSEFSKLRIGRQEWRYNASRLLSHRGWWTTGLSYDALLYKYHNKSKGLFFDLGISYNNDMKSGTGGYVNAFPDRLKTVSFLNLKKNIGQKFNATLNVVLSGRQDDVLESALYMKSTEGIILNYNMNKKKEAGIFGSLSAYYQHGTQALKNGGNSKVSAYMLDIQLGYRTNNEKLSVSMGMELLSGHDQSNTDSIYKNETHTFDLLYGGCHPYYGGQMDYFVTPANTMNGGLMDPYLRTKFKINKKNSIQFNMFLPMLATNVNTKRLDASGNPVLFDKFLGVGADLCYFRNISKDVKFKIAASFFNMSNSYREMRGFLTFDTNNAITDDNSGVQYMIYTMLTITPSFFDSSKKK